MRSNTSHVPPWALATAARAAEPSDLRSWEDLQRLVQILARLSSVELFIINAEYMCIAGSGPYEEAVGCVSPTDTAIGYSLSSGRPTLVSNPGSHDACRSCSQRTACRDVANYTAPIAVGDRVVAAVQIVAFNARQSSALQEKAEDLAEAITMLMIRMCEAEPNLRTSLVGLSDEAERNPGLARIVGESPAMRTLKDSILRAAPLDSTVLVQGESGTGKELVAQAIHDLSPRAAGPFVAVNCGAIPEAIIESELFGYVQGTFTGAQRGGKPGLFEHAEGGTLFLDEIAELPLPLQVKLLRVLQERKVMRLGGHKEHPFDVRIIAAANVDVAEKARLGQFRLDLYYRLSVVPLRVPALRERDRDIELLVHHFARLYARRRNEPPPTVEGELMRRFLDYAWPGNVRELKNFVEYGVNFRKGRTMDLATLADRFDSMPESACVDRWPREPAGCPASAAGEGALVQNAEEEALRLALHRFGTSLEGKRRAAASLGVSLATLYRKLKRLELSAAYRYDTAARNEHRPAGK
jgi:transcriptional regulator with PAS, ATPase and Fis domain